jgi:hypothetical protein
VPIHNTRDSAKSKFFFEALMFARTGIQRDWNLLPHVFLHVLYKIYDIVETKDL